MYHLQLITTLGKESFWCPRFVSGLSSQTSALSGSSSIFFIRAYSGLYLDRISFILRFLFCQRFEFPLAFYFPFLNAQDFTVIVNEIESFMSVVIGIFISDFDCHESILFNFKC